MFIAVLHTFKHVTSAKQIVWSQKVINISFNSHFKIQIFFLSLFKILIFLPSYLKIQIFCNTNINFYNIHKWFQESYVWNVIVPSMKINYLHLKISIVVSSTKINYLRLKISIVVPSMKITYLRLKISIVVPSMNIIHRYMSTKQ